MKEFYDFIKINIKNPKFVYNEKEEVLQAVDDNHLERMINLGFKEISHDSAVELPQYGEIVDNIHPEYIHPKYQPLEEDTD